MKAIIHDVFHRDMRLIRFEDGSHIYTFDEDEEDGTFQSILEDRKVTELKFGRVLYNDFDLTEVLKLK